MTPRSERLVAAGAGAVLAFLILESSLRILGSQYQPLDVEDASLRHVISDTEKTVILCVGDSVTYGIGAGRGNDYPRQLERRLNADRDGEPFIVVNSGLAGANSAMIRARLPLYLDATAPDIVTLLAGCANATNFFGYSSHVKRDSTLYKVMEVVFKVRTFRMIRAYATKLRQPREIDTHQILDGMEASIAAYLKWHESSETGEELSPQFLSGVDWLRLGRFEDAIEDFQMGRQGSPERSSNYWGLGVANQGLRERTTALEWFSECIRIDPDNPTCYFGAGEIFIESGREYYDAHDWFESGVAADPTFSGNYFGLGMVAMLFGPPHSELDWFLKCIEIDPDDARCYPNLVKNAVAEDGTLARIEPALEEAAKSSQVARDSYRMLKTNTDRQEVFAWIKADLNAMIDMSQERGITVMLQDYPVGMDENAILHEIAAERSLPIVEHQATYSAHYYWTGGEPDLFSMDRTHPNDAGYSLMAENLYLAIVRSDAVESDPQGTSSGATQ